MKELKELGFTEYEIKIYTALLKEGQLSGGDVSKKSKVPHGRTYEVLQKLVDKGFVSVIPIKPKVFKVVNPKIAIKNHIQKKREELLRLEKDIPKNLKEIQKEPEQKVRTSEKIQLIWGTKNVRPHIVKPYQKAKEYVKVLFTYEYVSSASVRAIEAAMKRGVAVYRLGTKMTDAGLEYMKADVARGCHVRYHPVEELRLTIIDGEKCDISIVNPKDFMDRTFIEIESKELTVALESYFDTMWKKAQVIS